MFVLPNFNPTAIQIGFIKIRWYALSYVVGFLIGLFYCYFLSKKYKLISKALVDSYSTYLLLAIIIGGRLGYILFYGLSYYLHHPLSILYVWQGGMSFHGAVIAIAITTLIFAKLNKIHIFTLTDLITTVAPIGLLLGRIANFINMELWGRPTNMPWGVIFLNVDKIPRHPSSLYEAFLEGIVLLIIMFFSYKKQHKNKGFSTAIFMIFYAVFRIFVEFFRQPDTQIGFIYRYFTLGQLLSIFMLLGGIVILYFCLLKQKKGT